MTLAELVIVLAVLAGLIRLLLPLQRWIARSVARAGGRNPNGRVIDATFRTGRSPRQFENEEH
jgi:hypothetical protein